MASTSTSTCTSMEVSLPDSSKIRVSSKAKAVNDVAELVQINSAARVNLKPKEQAAMQSRGNSISFPPGGKFPEMPGK
jgi:hypothetical protein